MPTVKKVLTNDTFKQFWVSSGSLPSIISAAILDGNDNIVSSGTGVSSGNGHFYRTTSVNSPGWYVSEWKATISGSPYRRRFRFKANLNEVD